MINDTNTIIAVLIGNIWQPHFGQLIADLEISIPQSPQVKRLTDF